MEKLITIKSCRYAKCNKSFETTNGKKMFCSPQCQVKYHNDRNMEMMRDWKKEHEAEQVREQREEINNDKP